MVCNLLYRSGTSQIVRFNSILWNPGFRLAVAGASALDDLLTATPVDLVAAAASAIFLFQLVSNCEEVLLMLLQLVTAAASYEIGERGAVWSKRGLNDLVDRMMIVARERTESIIIS